MSSDEYRVVSIHWENGLSVDLFLSSEEIKTLHDCCEKHEAARVGGGYINTNGLKAVIDSTGRTERAESIAEAQQARKKAVSEDRDINGKAIVARLTEFRGD